MSDGWDILREQIVEHTRDAMAETILAAAREVQDETGDEFAGLTFDYEKVDDVPLDDKPTIGKLLIHGVPLEVAERFHARVAEKLGAV